MTTLPIKFEETRNVHEVAAIGLALSTIEAKVSEGNYNLKELGFWKLVAQARRKPKLAEKFGEQIARIDIAAHKANWISVPLWLGHAVEILVTIFGTWLLYIALIYEGSSVKSAALVGAAFWLSFSLHPLTHYAVGRVLGINFKYYFLHGLYIFFRSPGKKWWKLEPSLKVDYASYLRASPRSRAIMHASGAVVTKLTILLVLLLGIKFNVSMQGIIATAAMLALYILTDLLYSTKSADWSKVKRELKYLF